MFFLQLFFHVPTFQCLEFFCKIQCSWHSPTCEHMNNHHLSSGKHAVESYTSKPTCFRGLIFGGWLGVAGCHNRVLEFSFASEKSFLFLFLSLLLLSSSSVPCFEGGSEKKTMGVKQSSGLFHADLQTGCKSWSGHPWHHPLSTGQLFFSTKFHVNPFCFKYFPFHSFHLRWSSNPLKINNRTPKSKNSFFKQSPTCFSTSNFVFQHGFQSYENP